MKRIAIGLICCCLAVLGGCVPGVDDGTGGSVGEDYLVDVSYNLSSVVVVTPAYDPNNPEDVPESYEELEPISAIISSGVSVLPTDVRLAGDVLVVGMHSSIDIVLNEAKDMILSASATRVKNSGVEREWERTDSILATNIPLIPPEKDQPSNISVYRLSGTGVCSSVSFLDYKNVRSATNAVPDVGPSYAVKNTAIQQCSETSYIEITIEAMH